MQRLTVQTLDSPTQARKERFGAFNERHGHSFIICPLRQTQPFSYFLVSSLYVCMAQSLFQYIMALLNGCLVVVHKLSTFCFSTRNLGVLHWLSVICQGISQQPSNSLLETALLMQLAIKSFCHCTMMPLRSGSGF